MFRNSFSIHVKFHRLYVLAGLAICNCFPFHDMHIKPRVITRAQLTCPAAESQYKLWNCQEFIWAARVVGTRDNTCLHSSLSHSSLDKCFDHLTTFFILWKLLLSRKCCNLLPLHIFIFFHPRQLLSYLQTSLSTYFIHERGHDISTSEEMHWELPVVPLAKMCKVDGTRFDGNVAITCDLTRAKFTNLGDCLPTP